MLVKLLTKDIIVMNRTRRNWTAEEDELLRKSVQNGELQRVSLSVMQQQYHHSMLHPVCLSSRVLFPYIIMSVKQFDPTPGGR